MGFDDNNKIQKIIRLIVPEENLSSMKTVNSAQVVLWGPMEFLERQLWKIEVEGNDMFIKGWEFRQKNEDT